MKKEDYPKLAQEEGTYFLWYVAVNKGDIIYREPVFKRTVEHEHGKRNNTSPDWWLLTDTQLQMREANRLDPEMKRHHYKQTNEELDKEEAEGNRFQWIPYGDKFACDVNSWSYVFKTYNVLDHYSKYDSDEWSVKARTSCQMYCNGVHVWEFSWSGKDTDAMIAKARVLSTELTQHHGFDANDPNKIIGKKVWYHDQEGIISRHMFPEDRIVVQSAKPDGTGFNLKERSKNKDKEDTSGWPDCEWHGSKEVHTGLFDSNIDWFRS